MRNALLYKPRIIAAKADVGLQLPQLHALYVLFKMFFEPEKIIGTKGLYGLVISRQRFLVLVLFRKKERNSYIQAVIPVRRKVHPGPLAFIKALHRMVVNRK